MYRALKTFYLISRFLFYNKRRKIINYFVLTLRSHRANIKNVVKVFAKSTKEINQDIKIIINRESKIICVFVITFLEDLS